MQFTEQMRRVPMFGADLKGGAKDRAQLRAWLLVCRKIADVVHASSGASNEENTMA
jgi:hypothetical protein